MIFFWRPAKIPWCLNSRSLDNRRLDVWPELPPPYSSYRRPGLSPRKLRLCDL